MMLATGNDAKKKWEHFAHDADIGIRGIGPTCSAAFEQAAEAMTAVVVDLATVRDSAAVQIECEGADTEILLVEWLNALVFEMATRRMLFRRYEVKINGTTLAGKAFGETIDASRHSPAVEIKGATFTCLAVRQRDDGMWVAQCVVDV